MRSSFAEWQEEISHEIYVTEGLKLEECPTFHWWIHFNNGLSPSEAVSKFLSWEEPNDGDSVSSL